MAAPLLFACQRQQCPYGTNVREHMKSHIMNEHQVKPWECAEAGCGVTYARADLLRKHTRKAHGRAASATEQAGNPATKAAVKAEVNRAARAPAPPPPPPPPPPPAPVVALPAAAPLAAAPPAAAAATTTTTQAPTLDALERPGYFFYHGLLYGTGPDIPGGRR